VFSTTTGISSSFPVLMFRWAVGHRVYLLRARRVCGSKFVCGCDSADRIMFYLLEGEGANLEYFGKVDIGVASTLHALQVALETNDALELPFNLWDTKDKRHMRKKLERLIGFSKEIHFIRVTKREMNGNKHRKLGDMPFTATSVKVAPAMVTKVIGGGVDPTLVPERSSRVSGSVNSANVRS
jgi:hypothetical protein